MKLRCLWKKKILKGGFEKRNNCSNNRWRGGRRGRKKAARKREEWFGARKLKMIIHLLNPYSALLGLRREKKTEVSFVFLSLLLPFLLPLWRSFLPYLIACHFHYASCIYFIPFLIWHKLLAVPSFLWTNCYEIEEGKGERRGERKEKYYTLLYWDIYLQFL